VILTKRPIVTSPQAPNLPNPAVKNQGLGSFFVGMTYPVRAVAALFRYPQLRSYVLWPIALNIVLGITLYSLLLSTGLQLIDHWISSLPELAADLAQWQPPALPWTDAIALAWPSWLHWPSFTPPHLALPHLPQLQLPQLPLPQLPLPGWLLHAPMELVSWLLRLVLTILLLLVTGFVLLQFGFILGAPFYGKLSETIEQLKTGRLEVVEISAGREIGRAILYELKKLVLLVGIGLGLLLLNLLPGVGTAIASLGTLALGSYLVCLDFFDSTLERRRLKFRQKLRIVQQSLPASAGFALVCFGIVNIPLINLVGIPLCVVAGSLFCCDRILPSDGRMWLTSDKTPSSEKS
jgi:CysZ protein